MATYVDRLICAQRDRRRRVPWPGWTGGGEPPEIELRALSALEQEAAYLAAQAHLGKKVSPTDYAFIARERIEQLFRGLVSVGGERFADSAASIAQLPPETIAPLYQEWAALQASVAPPPISRAEIERLVEGVKKNSPEIRLEDWPIDWLRRAIVILADQSSTSIVASSSS